MDAYPALDDVFAPFETDAWIAMPGPGEFNPEPETGPVKAVFLAAPPQAVPSQLDADTFERADWLVAFRRVDVPGLIKGAVVRAAPPGETVTQRWFIQALEERGDEVRAFVKVIPEPA